MIEHNELRLFEELRFHPWKPEQMLKINGFIAQMSVEDPPRAQKFRELYDRKMAMYHLANAPADPGFIEVPVEAPVVVAPVEVAVEGVVEKPAEVVPTAEVEKPKKKKKLSPTPT